jgi:arabinose-5-phosphate isomerase
MNPTKLLDLARAVLENEADSVRTLSARLNEGFVQACEFLLQCTGRVVVTGMGKSGHIGNKIAATLASTGTPSFFVHPGEASHGDLGMITDQDVVIALSNSGETDELLTILPIIKRLGVPLIAMTGRPQSTLATNANVHLDISVKEEACPLGLAPTSSTTATLAMGDALAVAVLESRGFTAEDFARSHPAGALGRRLLLHVGDIMHSGDALPAVHKNASLRETVLEMTRKRLGMTAIVDTDHKVLGVFTDGDLRRCFDQGTDLQSTTISAVMTRNPTSLQATQLAEEALRTMESRNINGVLVTDSEGRLVGALNMLDLVHARVV